MFNKELSSNVHLSPCLYTLFQTRIRFSLYHTGVIAAKAGTRNAFYPVNLARAMRSVPIKDARFRKYLDGYNSAFRSI